MNNTQNFTIAVLLIVAVVLGALVVSTYVGTSHEAYAEASVKQSIYVMGTGFWNGTMELVYILDISARKLNAYSLDTTNPNAPRLTYVDSADLERVFPKD